LLVDAVVQGFGFLPRLERIHGRVEPGQIDSGKLWFLDRRRGQACSPVTVSAVLRFLIHDLGVMLRCADWSETLRASETKFHEEFTSKGYKGPLGVEPSGA
jgi:hypothetical protein